jgi:hypothetical protein
MFNSYLKNKRIKEDEIWADHNKILAHASFKNENKNLINIKNVRNFKYFEDGLYEVNYYDKTFDICKLKKIYFIVQPFALFNLIAHTFVSFEFEKENYLSVSIEIRKSKKEKVMNFKKLFARRLFSNYEVVYIVGDEKDLIKYRTNYLRETIYLYPLKTSRANNKLFFLDIISKINKLKKNSEPYGFFSNNCTTSLVRHINKIRNKKIKIYSLAILLTGLSDRLARKLKLLDIPSHLNNAPLKAIRKYYNVNSRALKYENCKNFSHMIRSRAK